MCGKALLFRAANNIFAATPPLGSAAFTNLNYPGRKNTAFQHMDAHSPAALG